ncbi:bacterial Ig-like domain-containing protein, partial [Paucilactobacillus suebicus]
MQNNNSKYTGEEKTHFKLYKSGKSWLIGGISSLMLFTGVVAANQVTAHADASTGTSDASLTKEGSSAADTNSVTLSAASATATTADTTNSAATSASNDSDTASSAASSSSVSNATNQNSSSTSASGATSASEATSASSAQTSNATSAGSSSSDTNSTSTDGLTSTSANTLVAASSAATSSVSSALVAPKAFSAMVAADDTTVTAKEISSVPNLSNFFVGIAGTNPYATSGYILYNSTTTLKVYPYSGFAVNEDMYGFYIVLPTSITADLTTLQTNANTFLTTLQADGFEISSLDVYQLNNTSDGREVFYFRPNDGATRTESNSATPELDITVETASSTDTTPSSVQVNANTLDELADYSVLYAGIGDNTISSVGSNYVSIDSSTLGSNIPDANIAAIYYPGIGKTLTYTHVNVVDTYNVVDTVTGDIIKTITTQGQDGDTYSRADLVATLALLGLDPTKYFEDSLSINSGTLTDTETYTPDTTTITDPTALVDGSTYTVYVTSIQTAINVKDSTLIAGPDTTWEAADNFVSAKDENGNALSISGVTVTGTVNTNVPGTYQVTYSYTDSEGNVTSEVATITVVASQASVTAKDTTLVAGPSTSWTAADNFVSATDENGDPVDLSDVTVTGTVDTTVPGTYQVTYSYTDVQGNVETDTANVTVVASEAAVKTTNTTVIAGPDTPAWTAADNFTSATDENGNPLTLSDVTVTGTADTTTPGTYDVTYSYTDDAGNLVSSTATITVVASKAAVNTKNTTLVAGPSTSWSSADNFVSATDALGNAVGLSDVTVTGTVDPTTPGTYDVTYSYTDSVGNVVSKTATVTVVASQSSIDTKDTTVVAGPDATWTAANNFV